jgi:gamma-glutamylcyclotransferase (GGCT)/AIG2-like uncharacterized protein YtfP
MISQETIVAFAYGSNMLERRLKERVPSAQAIGVGQLKGHVLKWHKVSTDGSGKCDAAHTGLDADIVWGVLFKLQASEKSKLDEVEGLHKGYEEKYVEVLIQNRYEKAQIYYATGINATLQPHDWYKDFVVAGACEHDLPNEYVAMLEATVSKPDRHKTRPAEKAKLLSEALKTSKTLRPQSPNLPKRFAKAFGGAGGS